MSEEKEIIEDSKKRFLEFLSCFKVDDAIKLAEELKLPVETIKEGFKYCLENWRVDDAIKLAEELKLPVETIKEGFKYCLERGRVDDAIKLAKELELSKEFLKEGFKYCLERGWVNEVIQLAKELELLKEFLKDGEVIESAKKGFKYCLENGRVDDAIELAKELKLPVETIKEGFKYCLEQGWVAAAIKLAKELELLEEFLEDADFIESAKKGFKYCLERQRVNAAIKLAKEFKLSEEFLEDADVIESVKKGFKYCLERQRVNAAIQLAKEFKLPVETIKEGFKYCLENGRVNDAIELAKELELSKEFLNSSEVVEAKKVGAVVALSKGLYDDYKTLVDGYEESPFDFNDNPERIRSVAKVMIMNFFVGSNKKEELEQAVKSVVSRIDTMELETGVLDITKLPIGIKVHTKNDSGLSEFLQKTGGFVAHSQETCLVAPPVINQYVLNLCIEVLKEITGASYEQLFKDSYIQVCCPVRLDNRLLGIATIAQAFSLERAVNHRDTKHNQQVSGLGLHDGERDIGQNPIPEREPGKLYFPKTTMGRTDLTLCESENDISRAHLILTLLAHSTLPKSRLNDLGNKFIEEFMAILKSHGPQDDWLNFQFDDFTNKERLGRLLDAIKEERDKTNRLLEKYAEMPSSDPTKPSKFEEIQNTIWHKIYTLLERYGPLIYEGGHAASLSEYK